MKNPLESPNFWLALVVLVTAFAFFTYSGPQTRVTGLAIGTSIPDGEEAVDVMNFSDMQAQPIVIDTIDIEGTSQE